MARSPMTCTRRRGLAAAALAVVLALGAAACGSDDDDVQAAAAGSDTASHDTTAHDGTTADTGDRIDPVAFHADMRELWEDHVTWTRLFIGRAIAGLPDVDATAARLLQNQADIGDAVADFYGDEAGAQLTDLLPRSHPHRGRPRRHGQGRRHRGRDQQQRALVHERGRDRGGFSPAPTRRGPKPRCSR